MAKIIATINAEILKIVYCFYRLLSIQFIGSTITNCK